MPRRAGEFATRNCYVGELARQHKHLQTHDLGWESGRVRHFATPPSVQMVRGRDPVERPTGRRWKNGSSRTGTRSEIRRPMSAIYGLLIEIFTRPSPGL